MSEASQKLNNKESPLDSARLAAAVSEGILTEDQAERLTDFWTRRGVTGPLAETLPHADIEEVRFVRGFHDIFISLGIGILMVGLIYGLQHLLPAWAISAVGAVSIWGLAEVFSRRMRLALPSFLLSLAFTPFFFMACFGLVVDQDLTGLSLGGWRQNYETWLVIPTSLVALAGAVLFYLRFKVPVGIAGITGGCLFIVAVLIEMAAPGLIDRYHVGFFLALGLVTFGLAMSFDIKDPARVTLNSDKAFWLHLMAAPFIVHSILALVASFSGQGSVGYSVAVIALFVILAIVALIVDRRALLVSAMSYLGFAIGYLILEANVSEEAAFAVTLLLLGGFILLIGSGWSLLRRVLLAPFSGQPLLRYLPATT
ncbi:hypothetical protein [Roseibium alexandrii]|uniref:DUF2157 domain-containing protein n=2 Tax=Roseibium alexandrii TaxID=388408 RepID=A0A0M7A899_9HYPH|nr:hypothetical protein [Roseibium alexandrii]EEE46798.2 hypothetical protein SADFL11_4087 [Roseibium alexandrii DFL-11]CTQ71328.1 hypothetical protein LAX5112_02783 [Roseibium alexandrii]